jgi:hypothetical protein
MVMRRKRMEKMRQLNQKKFTSLSPMNTRRRLTLTPQTSEPLSTVRKSPRKHKSEM